MESKLNEQELLDLSSTYAFLITDRVLDRFGLSLTQSEIAAVMKNPRSIYFQLLLVPCKNIINGIIYQQAYDYQVYAQKLFIDYLVSGSANDAPDSPGAAIRDDLEQIRLKLVELSEEFEKDVFAHKTLINQSQGKLVELVKTLKPIQDNETLATQVAQTMSPYLERVTDLAQVLRNDRIEFKNIILDTQRLILLLPDYPNNEAQGEENRSALLFDDQLG